MAIGSNRQDPLSFFKVIRYPSEPHLSLPIAFVKRHLKKIPKNPTLITKTGERSWRMKLVKIGGNYCFAHGWEKLVKDVGLCSRDIVVFWLVDSSTFHVLFLQDNGCEKELPVHKTNEVVRDDDGKDDDVVGECYDEYENPYFKKVLTKTSRNHMLLPIKFVKAAGLEHKQSVKVKDHEGKKWTMGILIEKYTSTKYSLSAGWAMFRNYHNLSVGDECEFTFDKQQDVLNLTLLSKTKTPIARQQYPIAKVKTEDECSPTEKPCAGGGGAKVKTEYESGLETDVGKRKSKMPRLERCANVKVEDGCVPAGKRMRSPEEPRSVGGVEVGLGNRAAGVANRELAMERVFRTKHVVYF